MPRTLLLAGLLMLLLAGLWAIPATADGGPHQQQGAAYYPAFGFTRQPNIQQGHGATGQLSCLPVTSYYDQALQDAMDAAWYDGLNRRVLDPVTQATCGRPYPSNSGTNGSMNGGRGRY